MIVLDADNVSHEVTQSLEDMKHVTTCQRIVVGVAMEGVVNPSCERCCQPALLVTEVPARPRKRSPNAHRPARDSVREARDGLQHAHKAVVAALEWFQRGDDMQFMSQTLDQAHLAYRFIEEILVKHRRIEPREHDYEDVD